MTEHPQRGTSRSDIDWRGRWAAAEAHVFEYQDIPGSQGDSPFAEFDGFGRKKPRRLGVPDYLLLIARIEPGRVRRVPVDAITEEGDDETGLFSFVNCPCGARPVVRQSLEKCPGCARNYVEVAPGAVYVVYGAMAPPPLPS